MDIFRFHTLIQHLIFSIALFLSHHQIIISIVSLSFSFLFSFSFSLFLDVYTKGCTQNIDVALA